MIDREEERETERVTHTNSMRQTEIERKGKSKRQ